MSDVPIEGRADTTMGAATLDAAGQIDIRAELVRIDRDRAETQKLLAEGRKLLSEERKLRTEDGKLSGETAKMWSEAFKLDRDRSLAPWLMLSSLTAALFGGVVVVVLSHLWK